MYPDDADSLEALGRTAERLLREPQRWVVRRKESISFDDDRVVRRTVSIDYDLGEGVIPSHHTGAGDPVFYAPLFFLQKGAEDAPARGPVVSEPDPLFACFDLRDAAGRAMSLPPRHWNASVSIEALSSAMHIAAGRLEIDMTEGDQVARAVLEQIARRTRNESVILLKALVGEAPIPVAINPLRELLKGDLTFAWLTAACAESSVAMIPLVGTGALQGIVKLAFLQEIHKAPFWGMLAAGAGVKGLEVWFDTPYVGARTHHIEITAPDGVEIYEAGVASVPGIGAPESVPVALARHSAFASQVHLYVDDATKQHGVLTWIRLRSRRRGFVGVAACVSILVTTVLWLAYALSHNVVSSPAAIPALLLLFPGLVAGYAARPGSHPFATRLLFLARMLLIVVAATPYVAAAALATVPRKHEVLIDERFKDVWLVCAIVASLCTLMLSLAWLLPQPLRVRQRYIGRPVSWVVARLTALRRALTGL